jgi:hypothetical protein
MLRTSGVKFRHYIIEFSQRWQGSVIVGIKRAISECDSKSRAIEFP